MRKTVMLAAAAALLAQGYPDVAAAQTRTTLDIYVIDVEGGNAMLFVSPSGDSLLIDTGNVAAGGAVRDAGRIMAAIKDAGLTQIDHSDHYALARRPFRRPRGARARIPIRRIHRPRPERAAGPAADEFLQKVYPQLYRQRQAHGGQAGRQDRMAGLDVRRGGVRRRDASRRRCRAPASPIPTAPISSRATPTPRTRCRSASTSRSENSAPCIWAT